jgi:nucleoside-diphosphate-sugar epimerase
MAKVLVTGASGFVGAHLAATLTAHGDEVTCLVRRTSRVDRLSALGVRLAYGDVTDASSVQLAVGGAEVVYHVAGIIRALRAAEFYRVNTGGTRNVVDACARQSQPPVMVFVSSLAAAGPALHGVPRVETDRPLPVSNYGRSKRQAELVVQQFADRVPISVVRPPIVFGEADPVSFDMFRSVAKFGVHMVPGIGRHRFSMVHADDLVNLMILAARCGRRLLPPQLDPTATAQGCYFAACETDPTYTDLGRMIGQVLGRRRVATLHASAPFIWCVAAVGELAGQVVRRPMFMNLDKFNEITAGAWCCSAESAIRDLGYAVGAPLLERLRQTADWYRREKWL